MPVVVRMGVLSVIYIATAQVGLSLDAVQGFAAAVWPPTGIALAALVLYGPRLWPGIAVGAFLVNGLAGAPALVACGMALGNTLEALLGAVLLTRVVRVRPALDRLRDVLGFIVLAAGFSTLVGATLGVTSGWLGGVIPTAQYETAWRTWWLGDAMGVLVVAPLLFVWSRRGHSALPQPGRTEALVLLAVVGVLSFAVFGHIFDLTLINFSYLVFPPLIWVAVRLGPRGAATATALVSASAIWGTVRGIGPFAGPALHESLFMLQAFMSVVAGPILVLAAVTAERRQVQAAVHEQRERLHVTLSSIGDAVMVTDSQGRVTFLNPVAAALTGWSAAEALGKDIAEVFAIVDEHTRQAVENPIATVMRAGTVVGLANHTLLLARDGVEHPIDDSAAPIRDPQGRLLGVVLVFRDITARRQAEAELTQREASQRFLAEASTLLSSSLDATTLLERLAGLLVPILADWCSIDLLQDDGRIHRVAVVHADPTKADLVEQLRQQYPLLAAEAPHTLARVLRTGQSWFDPAASPARLRAEARDAAHWELIQALGFTAEIVAPLLVRGKVLGTITCVLGEGARRYRAADLTLAEDLAHRAALAFDNARLYREARTAQAALQQVNATLEQRIAERTAALQQAHDDLRREMAERHHMQEALFQQEKLAALGTLLANVAHELNNPLAVAAMQLDSLQEEGGSGTWSEDVEILRQAVERCQSVVQSFLALARQQPPTRHAVALRAVINDVLVLLEHALAVDGIAIERHLPDDLPPLWADPHQLHHVMANLITNAHYALRQTPPPRHLRLTAAAMADRSQVRLEVADSGPGIPPDVQRRVFEPFFTTKPQGVGSGLGLPLCRNIVEGHGGSLHLASRPGHGTTVSVILPAAAAEVQVLEASPEAAEPRQRQGGTILIIDDEPGMQRALRRVLQRFGYEITTAVNGLEGLSALEARSYEVILCDMRMPDLDGPGFYRELEQRYPHLRSCVIFLTGDVLSPEAEDFFARVDNPRLEKPFKAREVQRIIQQVLDAR